MYKLIKVSVAIAAVGLSTVLFMANGNADGTDSINSTDINDNTDINDSAVDTQTAVDPKSNAQDVKVAQGNNPNTPTQNDNLTENTQNTDSTVTAQNNSDISPVTNSIGQQPSGNVRTVVSPNKFLPTIKYTTENLSTTAKKVNAANWKAAVKINRSTGTRLQALLNWQQSGVGPVDGYWGKNTRKAMQAFQMARGLTITETLNDETWQALTKSEKLMAQPVLVNYQLGDADINIKMTTIPTSSEAKAKLDGMYYESVLEGLAEKFHMSESYLKSLNPNASFSAGEVITVYNPSTPNTKPVSRVVADRTTQTLYAYDDKDTLIASYPTTVGSTATPSPSGTHKVKVKVYEPNYTYTQDDGSKLIIPPGPNNPVGSVWIGLSKPTYGIHGSPDPARISRQASAGCVRLTNWDALALLGTIQNGATVAFQ
ncbi:lipoprotein-anchoring transpeptidase ErfK/SrfK [Psychrobacter sp. PL19]|uniref:L,D-transpeptidase family protein n=1 Tax=Psychrobacter sp. PL19 TaxID=2760711 RepID=UPI001AEAA725